MEPDLISIIIPVFNTERYLAACLDSVLSQSYKNIEVIVINDGSTDYSLKIAEGYAEKDDRLIVYSYENEGQAAARNHGLDVATGNYICFVDSDDLLIPDALEMMIEILRAQEADIIEGLVIRGKVYKKIQYKKKIEIGLHTPIEAIENVLYQKGMLPSPCGKLYKNKLLENLRFKEGIIYEDLDIFYKIYERANKIVYINYPVYFYRDTDGSTINTWKTNRLDVLKVTESIENYISEKYPQLRPAAKDRRLSANFNMYALCSLNGDKEMANKCWNLIKKYRRDIFLDKKVRIKNKLGVALSYSGKTIFKNISRLVYKKKS